MVRWSDHLRAAPSLLCAAAIALCPAQAAADTPAAGAPELVSAFRTICLDHLGNAEAQAAAARAAPWRFAPDGTAGSMIRYRSELGAVGISEAAQSCTITAEIDPRADLSGFKTVMTASLDVDEGTRLLEADSVYWLIDSTESQEQFVMALKVSDETGRNLATLWVQKRASIR